jgi:hypothetical protein
LDRYFDPQEVRSTFDSQCCTAASHDTVTVQIDRDRSHEARRRLGRTARADPFIRGFANSLLTRVRWTAAGVDDALLLSPQTRVGALVLSPRAQGEALTGLLRGTMDARWSSSDGLHLDVHRMV